MIEHKTTYGYIDEAKDKSNSIDTFNTNHKDILKYMLRDVIVLAIIIYLLIWFIVNGIKKHIPFIQIREFLRRLKIRSNRRSRSNEFQTNQEYEII